MKTLTKTLRLKDEHKTSFKIDLIYDDITKKYNLWLTKRSSFLGGSTACKLRQYDSKAKAIVEFCKINKGNVAKVYDK